MPKLSESKSRSYIDRLIPTFYSIPMCIMCSEPKYSVFMSYTNSQQKSKVGFTFDSSFERQHSRLFV